MPPRNTAQDRVYNLNVELLDVKNRKKEANKDFNEEIKRIESEIKEIVDQEEHPVANVVAAA